MRNLLTLTLILAAKCASGQSWLPPVKIPVPAPIQYARPIDYEGAAAKGMAEGEAILRNKMTNCALQTENLYGSLSNHPASLVDGWYKARIVDGASICDERIVFVKNNRVTRYFNLAPAEVVVQISSLIEKGLATIKLEGMFFKCYFIDNIMDPSAKAVEPVILK
jgi:hypothetical protein